MSPTDRSLVVALSRLLALGRLDLPQLAHICLRLNQDVAGTADGDADAFGGTQPSLVRQPWTQLRNQLQDALGLTATGLAEAGSVVLSIESQYAASDGTAQRQLQQLWRNGPPVELTVVGDDPLPATLPPPTLSS